MAGYQCMLHDGEADAINIHQVIGKPGVIATCDECEPQYLISALAQRLNFDFGEFYENVRAFQLAGQGDEKNQPQPEDMQPPDIPPGPHPAVIRDASGIMQWDWCSCDAPYPHDQDAEILDGDVIALLTENQCPICGAMIRCTVDVLAEKMLAHDDSSQHQDVLAQQGGM